MRGQVQINNRQGEVARRYGVDERGLIIDNKIYPLDKYSEIIQKTISRNIPFKSLFELTYNCNLKCVHCYIVKRSKEELSYEEVTNILDQLKDSGSLYLALTGGEIFVREDVLDIARYARRNGFAVRLFTNGTLITPKIADEIKSIKPLEVEISLYGATPSTHEAVTAVLGSYAKTLLAIKLLLERDVRVHVKTSILKDNNDEIDAIRQMVEDMGAFFFYDAVIAPRDDGDKYTLACRASLSDLLRIFKGHGTTFQPKERAPDSPMCNAGMNSVCISPYGDVYPCVQIRKPLGNLREKSFCWFDNHSESSVKPTRQSFREIWEHSEVLAQLRAIKLSDLPVCSSCDLLPFCARCPGVALMEEGDILAPSKEACRIARIRKAIYLGDW